MKNTEAVLSIFVPALVEVDDDQAVYQAMMSVKQGDTYYTGEVFGHKVTFGDGPECAIVVSDRELSLEEANTFYEEIMEYHQAVGQDLSEEEMIIRDEEVKSKWLNGNFNWWCLGAGKLEDHACDCTSCTCPDCKE